MRFFTAAWTQFPYIRGLYYAVDFWGNIAAYIQELSTHVAMFKNWAKNETGPKFDPGRPNLLCLDQIMSMNLVKHNYLDGFDKSGICLPVVSVT